MPRLCPREGTPLDERRAGRSNVDVCPSCHGTFLDGVELARTVGDAEIALELAEMHGRSSTPLACPACGEAMALDTRDGIRLDHCHACLGVWLDGGELDRLASMSLTTFARDRAARLDLTLRDLAIALRRDR